MTKESPHKDGVDKRTAVVTANNVEEAIALATPGTFFECADGTLVAFGSVKITVRVPR